MGKSTILYLCNDFQQYSTGNRVGIKLLRFLLFRYRVVEVKVTSKEDADLLIQFEADGKVLFLFSHVFVSFIVIRLFFFVLDQLVVGTSCVELESRSFGSAAVQPSVRDGLAKAWNPFRNDNKQYCRVS